MAAAARDLFVCAAIAGAIGAGSSAFAETAQKHAEIGAGIGTLGFTVQGAYHLPDRLSPELIAGGLTYSRTVNSNNTTYAGTLKNSAVGLLLRYDMGNPMGVFVAGGAIWTNYSFDGTADSALIGSVTSTIQATVRQKSHIAPMLQLGVRFGHADGLHADASIGAIFGQGFDVSGTDPSGMFTQAQVDEHLAPARADAAKIKVIPMLKLGVAFNF